MLKAKAASPQKRDRVKRLASAAPSFSPVTKPFVQACVIFYNDTPEMLRAALTSIKPHVDRILAIDGAYKEFPHDTPWSTDGCREVANLLADEVIVTTMAYKDQITKRNQCFTGKAGDYYLIMDADEIFRGTLDASKLIAPLYAIPMEDHFGDGSKVVTDRIRVIRHEDGIAYKGCHAEIYIHDKILVARRMKRGSYSVLPDCTIEHHPYKRPAERQSNDALYMERRAENGKLSRSIIDPDPTGTPPGYWMLYMGPFCYNGDDGFGKTISVATNESVFISIEARDGLLESWPTQWKTLEVVHGESDKVQ